MDYLLNVNIGDGVSKEVLNPAPELIEEAIDTLIPVLYHHVLLEALCDDEEPIANCKYIQTMLVQDNSSVLSYAVEAQFEYNHDENTRKQFEYITTDLGEVKRIFCMFALGVVPNISRWADVTQETLYDNNEREP